MAHKHDVNSAEIDFTINPVTRTLTNNTNKTQIIQFDHNSERFTFELPRYIDGHDMSLCNKTEIHYINIGMDGTQNKGVYAVDDIAVSPDDDNVVIFSWLISANATQLTGSLNFIIRFVCLTDDIIEYAWHTNIYSGIKIKDSMNNGEEVVTEYADILAQWKKELEEASADYTKFENMVESKETLIVKVEENLVDDTKFIFDENYWTGNNEDGFTHTKGVIGSLTYNVNLTSGEIYLVEFDTSYTGGEFGVIGIGATPKSMMYNGTGHIAMFLYAIAESSGRCVLRLTPYENFEGTLSNFAIYKVSESGSVEKEVMSKSVLSQGHEDNYGFYDVIIGYNNMKNNPTSTRTICLGYGALSALKAGHRNVSIGTFSLSQLEEGDENVAIGADCAFLIKKGKGNIAIGKGALYKGDELNNNVVIGHSSMKGINPTSTVENNTAVGAQSNYYNNGSGNTTIGYRAGFTNKNGNNNTNIGFNADTADGCSNTIVIGSNAKATKSNQMVLGDKTITEVIFCGDKKIVFYEEFKSVVGDINNALDELHTYAQSLITGGEGE